MEGRIVNFRGGRHTQKNNQMVVLVSGVDDKEKANAVIGKQVEQVVWKSPAGKELKGKITHPHGAKGAVRVLFETGMPGQSVGSAVEVV